MRALVYRGHRRVELERVPDADVPGPDGALVRTTRFAICGSDLHGYHGPVNEERIGRAMGHECIGEVVSVGPEVRRFRAGDRVLVSAVVGCGHCEACDALLTARCPNREARVLGGPGLDAAQAEAIGVPAADSSLLRIPEGIGDEQAVLLTDILPTGYKGARGADIRPGGAVAVVGAGPVGQMAIETAFLFGPSRVFAIDQAAYRLAEAERLGAIPIDASQVDPVEAVLDQTGGRGCAHVVEAAGPQATVRIAFGVLAHGGTLSQVGATADPEMTVNLMAVFGKDLTYRVGLVSPQFAWPELVPLLREGRLHPERVFTHRLPMSEGPRGYSIFDERRDGVIKVLLDPAG